MSTEAVTCETCGRTYADIETYGDHACINFEDLAYAARCRECHEEVSRRDELQPCELPAVAVRIDSEFNIPYPVCKRHTRGPMVPLASVEEAAIWRATFPSVSPREGTQG